MGRGYLRTSAQKKGLRRDIILLRIEEQLKVLLGLGLPGNRRFDQMVFWERSRKDGWPRAAVQKRGGEGWCRAVENKTC